MTTTFAAFYIIHKLVFIYIYKCVYARATGDIRQPRSHLCIF